MIFIFAVMPHLSLTVYADNIQRKLLKKLALDP